MKRIYLDYAATTPVDPRVFSKIKPFFSDSFGNPNSAHHFGRVAQAACDQANNAVADFLNAGEDDIIFTSGATESNNLAILGLIEKLGLKDGHIIISAMEHPSVLEIVKGLELQGFDVDYINPQSNGVVRIEDFSKAVRDNTFLVSCMYVNNEIGTVQPIAEIGDFLEVLNKSRESNKIYFHCDAVQAAPYLDIDIKKLKVDFLTLSGHKIYTPKGVGVLYLKSKKLIKPLFSGGEQQSGLRPGTLNVSSIVGIGEACKLLKSSEYDQIRKNIRNIRDDLWEKIKNNIKGVSLNGSLDSRVPGNLNLRIEGVSAESLLILLDQNGLAASHGSACSAGAVQVSHVLESLGLSEEENLSSIRISLGKNSDLADNEFIIDVLKNSISKLRQKNTI